MLHQQHHPATAAKLGKGTHGSDFEALLQRRQRQRGLWSFLTWSFFVAHALSENGLVGSGVQAAEEEDVDPSTNNSNLMTDAGGWPPAARHGSGAEEYISEAMPKVAPEAIPANLQFDASQDGSGFHKSYAPAAPSLPTGRGAAGSGSSRSGTAQGGVDSGADGDGGDEPFQSLGNFDELLRINLDADVIGMDIGLDLGINLQLFQLVDNLTDDVGNSLSSLLNNSVKVVSSEIDVKVLDPIASASDELLSFASSGVDALVASGGNLIFHNTSTINNTVDDLFSAGRYTDYNLALQSSAADNLKTNMQPSMVQTGYISGLVEQLLESEDHSSSSVDELGSSKPNFSLPSAIEDVALRGLGDGIT